MRNHQVQGPAALPDRPQHPQAALCELQLQVSPGQAAAATGELAGSKVSKIKTVKTGRNVLYVEDLSF